MMPLDESVETAFQLNSIGDLNSLPVRMGGTTGGTCTGGNLQHAIPQHLPSHMPQQHFRGHSTVRRSGAAGNCGQNATAVRLTAIMQRTQARIRRVA